MAKRKAARRKKSAPARRVGRKAKASAKRPTTRRARPARRAKPAKSARPARSARAKPAKSARPARSVKAAKPRKAPRVTARKAPRVTAAPVAAAPVKASGRRTSPRLDRVRRTLDDDVVQTPPSSLNMDRHGSAARTGRAEIEEQRQNVASMGQDITGGDIDVDVEDAYFTGDEAPGGDNPSPDMDIVDDIGKALGVEYEDNEELKSSDKIVERDRHRWEMDPASSEDYKDRK